jgi:protein-tyrosine phosphatase
MKEIINNDKKIRVLFVCLGNICRSPAGEGALNQLIQNLFLVDKFIVDSCGTASYHIGELPHKTTRKVAMENGIHLTHRARQFNPKSDFKEFDFILAMDKSNLENLLNLATTKEDQEKLFLFRDFEEDCIDKEVPDPYYGNITGFQEVQSIVTKASVGFIKYLRKIGHIKE